MSKTRDRVQMSCLHLLLKIIYSLDSSLHRKKYFQLSYFQGSSSHLLRGKLSTKKITHPWVRVLGVELDGPNPLQRPQTFLRRSRFVLRGLRSISFFLCSEKVKPIYNYSKNNLLKNGLAFRYSQI